VLLLPMGDSAGLELSGSRIEDRRCLSGGNGFGRRAFSR
jgi:hypothetical protein